MAVIDYNTAKLEIDAEANSLSELPHNLLSWFECYRAPIRKEFLSIDPDGKKQEEFWLVTQPNGKSGNSVYRIAYDDSKKMFGIVCALQGDIAWFMGYYGSLKETIEHI